jgi:hypothetical protein
MSMLSNNSHWGHLWQEPQTNMAPPWWQYPNQPTIASTTPDLRGMLRADIVRKSLEAELALLGRILVSNYTGLNNGVCFWLIDNDLNCMKFEVWRDPHPYDQDLSEEDRISILAVLQGLITKK